MAGFTLIELLIVFTLVVILSAVLAPIMMPSPTRTLRAAASEIATSLRETRRLAQAEQARKRFLIDTQSGEFGVAGLPTRHELPEGIAIALTTGRSLISDANRGGIDFFPNGSSSGGRVSLGMDDRSLAVDVEWLTGRIRVQDPEP